MNKALLLLILAGGLASSAAAQENREVEVQDVDGGRVIAVTRSLQLPDEIGFAVNDYGSCLSDRITYFFDTDSDSNADPEDKAEIKAACKREREVAVFLAATALERLGRHDLDARKSMIFDMIDNFEEFMLRFNSPDLSALQAPSSDD